MYTGGELINASNTWGTTNTNWNPTGTGFVGFRFQNEANGNQVHYGWAQIINNGTSDRRLVDFAYEDVAGVEIAVGAVPAPGSLALLALGGMGLLGRRRK